jgi:hypothetical protein
LIQGDAQYRYNAGDRGTFLNLGTVRKEGGTGTTTFNGIPFTNQGTLELAQGTLRIEDNYAPTAGATLRTVVSGPGATTDFGRLEVSGTAQLNGELEVRLADGFVPPEGSDYAVLSAGAIVGTFAGFSSDLTQNNRYMNPVYEPDGVRLVTVDASGRLLDGQSRWQDGMFHLTIQGVANQSYQLEASTNLVDWMVLSSQVIPASTLWQFIDQDSTNIPVRFYRVLFLATP